MVLVEMSDIHQRLDRLIRRHNADEREATVELVHYAQQRLRCMSRGRSVGRHIKRWEASSDLVQECSLRFWKALIKTQLQDIRHFYRLLSLQFRRQVASSHKKLYGPRGLASGYRSDPGFNSSVGNGGSIANKERTTLGPEKHAFLREVYSYVSQLPEEKRRLWELLVVQQFSKTEAAHILGCDRRTILRRWIRLSREIADVLGMEDADL